MPASHLPSANPSRHCTPSNSFALGQSPEQFGAAMQWGRAPTNSSSSANSGGVVRPFAGSEWSTGPTTPTYSVPGTPLRAPAVTPLNGSVQFQTEYSSVRQSFTMLQPGPQFLGQDPQASPDVGFSARPERDGDVRIVGDQEIIRYSRLPDRGLGARQVISQGDGQTSSFSGGSRMMTAQGDSQLGSMPGSQVVSYQGDGQPVWQRSPGLQSGIGYASKASFRPRGLQLGTQPQVLALKLQSLAGLAPPGWFQWTASYVLSVHIGDEARQPPPPQPGCHRTRAFTAQKTGAAVQPADPSKKEENSTSQTDDLHKRISRTLEGLIGNASGGGATTYDCRMDVRLTVPFQTIDPETGMMAMIMGVTGLGAVSYFRIDVWEERTYLFSRNKESILLGSACVPMGEPQWQKRPCTWPVVSPENVDVAYLTCEFSLAGPPGPPREMQVEGATSTEAKLVWLPPAVDSGVDIDCYIVEARATCRGRTEVTASEEESPWLTVARVDPSRDMFAIIRELRGDTRYKFRVHAVNEVGSGQSAEIDCHTGPVAPGVCGQPRLAACSGTVLTIEWSPPSDDGGASIVAYRLWVRPHLAARGPEYSDWVDIGHVEHREGPLQYAEVHAEELHPGVSRYVCSVAALNSAGHHGPATPAAAALPFPNPCAQKSPMSPVAQDQYNRTASEAQLLCIEGMNQGIYVDLANEGSGMPNYQYGAEMQNPLRDALGGSNSQGFVVKGMESDTYMPPVDMQDMPPGPPDVPPHNDSVYNQIPFDEHTRQPLASKVPSAPPYESEAISLNQTLPPGPPRSSPAQQYGGQEGVEGPNQVGSASGSRGRKAGGGVYQGDTMYVPMRNFARDVTSQSDMSEDQGIALGSGRRTGNDYSMINDKSIADRRIVPPFAAGRERTPSPPATGPSWRDDLGGASGIVPPQDTYFHGSRDKVTITPPSHTLPPQLREGATIVVPVGSRPTSVESPTSPLPSEAELRRQELSQEFEMLQVEFTRKVEERSTLDTKLREANALLAENLSRCMQAGVQLRSAPDSTRLQEQKDLADRKVQVLEHEVAELQRRLGELDGDVRDRQAVLDALREELGA